MAKKSTAWRVLDHGRAQSLLKAIEESAMAKPAIPLPREQIAAFCRRWHVRELSLFGSVLRDDFRPDSDVDVLVDFEPDARWGLLDLCHMEDDLRAIFGRDVDLVTRRAVEESPNYIRRNHVLAHLETVYATR